MERGDRYCLQATIENIDLLKIDVEGAEPSVLSGFGDGIHPNKTPVVQFEYGRVNIENKFLLRDSYIYFRERGYLVGKLLPDEIRIREYSAWDEDFLGPNYVAIRPDLKSLSIDPTRL